MTSLHRANTVFRVLLACNVVLTAYWVVTQFTGHSAFYGGYQLTVSSVLAVLDVLVFGTARWGADLARGEEPAASQGRRDDIRGPQARCLLADAPQVQRRGDDAALL